MDSVSTARPLSRLRWPVLLLALLAVVVSLKIANSVGEGSTKSRIVALAVLAFPVVAVVTGRLKQLLLICWVGSLTYNRQYFSFEAITGNIGTQGPYWIISDVFLAGLLLHWLYEAAVLKKATPARGAAFWPWCLPFAAIGVMSLLVAIHPEWTLFELIRTVKFGIVLCYVRHQFDVEAWWTAVVALGLTMSAQSLIGIKEVVTGRSGFLGAEVSTTVGGFENVLSQESFYGWVRATGTMNHPPNLACYLMLIIPVFLGLTLTLRSPLLRLGAGLLTILGCAGLVCTMSRWPGALTVIEIGAVMVCLVAFGELSWRHAAGLTVIAICALIMVLVPMRDKVMDRLTRDFSASVDQRAEGNRVALAMIEEAPWFGVGLNNSKAHILKFIPELAWAFDNEDYLTRIMHSRSIAAMGNGFLFVTVELGIVGTAAYALYLLGSFGMAFRAIFRTRGAVKAACLGLTLGTAGVLLEQLVDFSVWIDPQLYTSALVVGMLTLAPTLFQEEIWPSAEEVPQALSEVAV
jgi:hypothetical protein